MSDQPTVIVGAEGTDEILDTVPYEIEQFSTEDGTAEFVRLTLKLGIVDLTVDFSLGTARIVQKELASMLTETGGNKK